MRPGDPQITNWIGSTYAARILGLTPVALWKWQRRDDAPIIHTKLVSGCVRYYLPDLVALVQSGYKPRPDRRTYGGKLRQAMSNP